MKHLLKARAPKLVEAKCGATPTLGDTTVWWREVTCPECLLMMGTITQTGTVPTPRKRLIKRRNAQ